MNHLPKVFLFLLLVGLFSVGHAQADYLYSTQSSDDWVDTISNWTCTEPAGNPSKVPGNGDLAIINKPGVASINSGSVAAVVSALHRRARPLIVPADMA